MREIMKCYVKSVFCNFENFQKHIDAVFLRIDIKLSFTTKWFGVAKIIIKMCHFKGLFRIQVLSFYNYDYNPDFWGLALYQKPELIWALWEWVFFLLKYTLNDSIACIRKVKSIESSSFSAIDSLYTITVSLWNKISSKWNRKAHWFDISSSRSHFIIKIKSFASFISQKCVN